jgi:two-component system, cell cycle sensor histidine kinase and response regulator CckA
VGLHKKRYTGLHVARKIPARTNAKYRAIVEFAPEILALIASDGAIQFANPHLQNVLQHKTNEVEGRNIFEFIHPDDAARAAQEYSDTIQKEGEHIPTVLRLRTAKGEWIPFEIIASNRLNDPDVQAVVFTARDLRFRDQIIEDAIRFTNADVNRDTSERITELAKINAALRIENQARRQAECKLQHTVSLLNATLDSTADGILVVSLDGKVTSCNKHFMEMWKIDANCAVGKSDQDLLSFVTEQLRSPNEFLDKVQALYADPSATSFDVLYLKDGRIFERYSQPQRFDGKVVGRVWSFRDVTRARNLELELRQAQKMEALGRLAGGIAHDFNNLLMLISGYISQLMESASPSQRDICQQLMATTKRAAGVTKQLLAFSRKLPDQAKVADLNEIVIGMGAMLRRLLSDQTELQLSVSSNPQPVKVDASRIELIIMNLAINAQDAMPKGGSLSIATTEVTKSEGKGEKTKKYSVLQMSDAGTGMSTEVRKHIFEPFFTTKGIGKGTGLGLSTVLGIVHESGGHIEVDSEPNRGTTFLVYLPQSEESLATSAPAAIVAPERGEETILLAEDEAGIRALTKAYLEGLGYLVLAAADGKEAIKISQEYDGVIHLVLTDLLMPGTRGDFAVEEIRKTRPNIQVILMSGYVDTEPLFSAEAMLHKPFDFPELGRRLREVLDQRTESISNLRRIDDGAGA